MFLKLLYPRPGQRRSHLFFVAAALFTIWHSNVSATSNCVGHLRIEVSHQSLAQLTAAYFTSEQSLQARYDAIQEEIEKVEPWQENTWDSFGKRLAQLHADRSEVLTRTTRAILAASASERLAYLRSLSKSAFLSHHLLLDALFGLRVDEMDQKLKRELESNGRLDRMKVQQQFGDEEIWYAPGAGQQSSWKMLFEAVEAMDLKPGERVADLGSGLGRLGLLIGLFYPEVKFTGLELVGARVQYATQAALDLGFKNVQYLEANLADPHLALPKADHFYLFNPTNPKTSDVMTEKLVALSIRKTFKVYVASTLQSNRFWQEFEVISKPGVTVLQRSTAAAASSAGQNSF